MDNDCVALRAPAFAQGPGRFRCVLISGYAKFSIHVTGPLKMYGIAKHLKARSRRMIVVKSNYNTDATLPLLETSHIIARGITVVC